MKDNISITDLTASVQKDLNIETGLSSKEKITYEEVHSALSQKINQLLHENKQLLFASLYRIDVAEKDVRIALGSKNTADLLAEMILQKLSDKIYWRNKYKSKNL